VNKTHPTGIKEISKEASSYLAIDPGWDGEAGEEFDARRMDGITFRYALFQK
jgi:hypothetical protein